MSISSALSAGVSGLAANASRLAGISDNIANSGTYGYRRMETDFESVVIGDSRGGRYTAGGVRTSSSRVIDETGGVVSTGNALDIAVSGRGMLPVMDAAQMGNGNTAGSLLLTRTGSFRTDDEGVLRTGSGLVLMGWPANADGTIPTNARDSASGLQPIVLNMNATYAAPTTRIGLASFNLPAQATVGGSAGAASSTTIQYYDNLGVPQTLTMTFVPTVGAAGTGRSNSWTLEIRDSAVSDDTATAADESMIAAFALDFDDSAGGPLDSVTAVSGGSYDAATGEVTINAAHGPMTISLGTPGSTSGLTQIAAEFTPTNVTRNGTPAGAIAGVEIDEKGYLIATYDNGASRTLFQVPLADVPNLNGLVSMDSQTFRVSGQSGALYLWNAGDGPTGAVTGYALESSTTDVAAELTDLIQTQRAYSSNAKIIQTVDEMLQETTNIKR